MISLNMLSTVHRGMIKTTAFFKKPLAGLLNSACHKTTSEESLMVCLTIKLGIIFLQLKKELPNLEF